MIISLICAGCGRVGFDYADDAPRCTFGPWSAPALVVELSADAHDYSPTISHDGRTVIFGSDRPGGTGGLDLYMATRPDTTSPFSSPVELAAIDTPADDSDPSLSGDGLSLYYDSYRGGFSALYVSKRASVADAFTTAAPLDGVLATLEAGAPELSSDELVLYFGSPTSGGLGMIDIWFATRPAPAAPWATLANISEVSSAGNDDDPSLEPDQLTLYVNSSRREGPNDLFVSTRADLASPFAVAALVPLGINPGVGEYGADVSGDGTTMILAIHDGAPSNSNIWMSTRVCIGP